MKKGGGLGREGEMDRDDERGREREGKRGKEEGREGRRENQLQAAKGPRGQLNATLNPPAHQAGLKNKG